MRWPAIMLPLLLAGCVSAGSCSLTQVARVPFITLVDDPRVMLPADVDHHPARLLLDTGSDSTALTDTAFHRLTSLERSDQSVVLDGVGGIQSTASSSLWRFALGVVARQLSVVVLDHSILPPIPPTDGLLGLDVVAEYDLDLDFAGGALGIYRPGGDCSSPHSMLTGRSFQVNLLPDIGAVAKPRFAVEVEGVPMVAEIDTGAPTTVVLASAAHRLNLGAGPNGRLVGGVGTGHVRARNVRLQTIKLGPVLLRDMPATVLDQDLMEPVDLLLGADFAHLVHVWISRSSHSVILQYPPAATSGQPG